jgi:hypothetical protein
MAQNYRVNTASSTSSPRYETRVTKRIARVKKLRKALAEIKIDVDTGKLCLNLARFDGRYCLLCSPFQKTGDCGPTCPLLCPKNKGGSVFHAPESWRRGILSQAQAYNNIVQELKSCEHNVSEWQLRTWECTAEKMRCNALNCSEKDYMGEPRRIKVEFQGMT